MPRLLPRGCRTIVAVVACFAVSGSDANAQQLEGQGLSIKWWHGAAAIGAYALLTTVDDGLQDFVRDNRSPTGNGVASVVRRMGQPEIFVTASLGVLATGLITGNDRVRDAGIRITSSLALAGTMVTVAKFTAGRMRPSNSGTDADDFHPFSGHASAPSGHTTMAFALATSLSDEIHNPWVTVGLYTAATATAWSRVNDDAHWASDVIAGAALGIVSAKFVSGRLRLFGLRSPVVAASPAGVSVSWSGSF